MAGIYKINKILRPALVVCIVRKVMKDMRLQQKVSIKFEGIGWSSEDELNNKDNINSAT